MNKKKLVFLVIAVMLSIGIVTATYVQEFQIMGNANAEWSNFDSHSGDWSVQLFAEADHNANAGRVTLRYGKTLGSISSISFWYKMIEGGHSPYVILELDTNNDDNPDDWIVSFDKPVSSHDWEKWDLTTHDDWHGVFCPGFTHRTLSQVISECNYENARIRKVKIAVGEWTYTVDVKFLVDDFVINDETILSEPVEAKVQKLEEEDKKIWDVLLELGIKIVHLRLDLRTLTEQVETEVKPKLLTIQDEIANIISRLTKMENCPELEDCLFPTTTTTTPITTTTTTIPTTTIPQPTTCDEKCKSIGYDRGKCTRYYSCTKRHMGANYVKNLGRFGECQGRFDVCCCAK